MPSIRCAARTTSRAAGPLPEGDARSLNFPRSASFRGLPEPEQELVGPAADSIVEHQLAVIVFGMREQAALAVEDEARLLEVALHQRGVDAMHRVDDLGRV